MAKFATHIGDPHCDPQTSPQHADPHGLGAFFFEENHIGNPCGSNNLLGGTVRPPHSANAVNSRRPLCSSTWNGEEKVHSFLEVIAFLYCMLLRNRRPPKWRVSYEISERSSKSSAEKMQGACMLKGQTQKKTRTLLFP